jgi:hypothetical protein
MVYVCHSVSDRAKLEEYWSSIGPTLKGQPIKLLATARVKGVMASFMDFFSVSVQLNRFLGVPVEQVTALHMSDLTACKRRDDHQDPRRAEHRIDKHVRLIVSWTLPGMSF